MICVVEHGPRFPYKDNYFTCGSGRRFAADGRSGGIGRPVYGDASGNMARAADWIYEDLRETPIRHSYYDLDLYKYLYIVTT